MILDNETQKLKVHEWITKFTAQGELDIVTGYFTVTALAFLAAQTEHQIDAYRLVLGDIVNFGLEKESALDLLNEELTVDEALNLKFKAQEAVRFLKEKKVQAKTLEPNFCHAKLYLQRSSIEDDPSKNYYILGSSNLTEAGIGLKVNKNLELNQAGYGSESDYDKLKAWFENIWARPEAHFEKTVVQEDGKPKKENFKEYLIHEIQKIFYPYSPLDLYYKVLFELFGEELLLEKSDPEFNRKIGKLENSTIYNTLYTFQQRGVLSLIKMLQKHNGAILADAVGLGKTWSALAVMKFFESEGYEVILICPKKLEQNWDQYLQKRLSRFENDKFNYLIRFHTDMVDERLDKYPEKLAYITSNKPKLFVIDESHNLRNDKSQRFQFLVEEILKKCNNYKLLMLSATPINNNLNDIRNQIKLINRGGAEGFQDSLDIKNVDYVFRQAQRAFKDWTQEPDAKIGELIKELPDNFTRLTDALIMARTRKMIEGESNLHFPNKARPVNIFKTPKKLGNIENFSELTDQFPPLLSGYTPSIYAESKADFKKRMAARKKGKGISVLDDEQQRDRFLVKMMYILLVKRLESSWSSFESTIEKVLAHHQNALDRIMDFEQKQLADADLETDTDVFDDDDVLQLELDEFTLGKKRKVHLVDIEKAGRLDEYKKHLKVDIKALNNLISNIKVFGAKVESELKTPRNLKSVDVKLECLIEQILLKRGKTSNSNNQKVLIFTVYKDTALYLFNQLKARGFTKLAMVSGDESRTSDSEQATKNFEHILERFAPYTKLYREKEWLFSPSKNELPEIQKFEEWKQWIVDNDQKTAAKLNSELDILIATDALSEGQNLQDCDMVVNYDIHWNPVRVIQRMGRIDRLGSLNEEIFGVNFWPSDSIEEYLNLKKRVEQRMAVMQLAGAEVDPNFTEEMQKLAEDEDLSERQKAKMLKQMETTWDDIEVSDKSFGFNDLSLEVYRQELMEQLRLRERFYRDMPKGVFTGFKAINESCPEPGMIALMGYPARPPKSTKHAYKRYALIYIDHAGKEVLLNHNEVLESLSEHKNEARHVSQALDEGNASEIKKWSAALAQWLKDQAVEEEVAEDGSKKSVAGKATMDLINKVKRGSKEAVDQLKTEGKPADKFTKENFDLITWFIVS